MNLFEAIVGRRSVRKFKDKDVDDKLIGIILYMATQAPSAGNSQEWKFIVVKNKELRKELAVAALRQKQLLEAPVAIVVFADLEKASLRYSERGEVFYSVQDTAAAIQNMLLTIHALGLASCWIGSFDEEQVKSLLEAPDNLRPVALLPVGYADEEPRKPERIPFENLTWAEKYGRGYELTVATMVGREEERLVGPLGTYLENFFREYAEKIKEVKKEKLTFEDFIKKLKRPRKKEERF